MPDKDGEITDEFPVQIDLSTDNMSLQVCIVLFKASL